MKIGNKDNVRKITLTHKGTTQRFCCILAPILTEGYDLSELESADIVFEDLCEIDIMIDILTRFKSEIITHKGSWKKED